MMLGYQIQEIYEVLHYDKTDDTLFKSYINTWLSVKQASSGWPSDITTDELKDAFCIEYNQREGTSLKPEDISKNPGLRFIAKLMLNTLWGKFAQRPNLPQTRVCTTLHEYYSILQREENNEIIIKNVKPVAQQTWVVTYEETDPDDLSPGNTNVAIASFVTSYARLHLYRQLEIVLELTAYFTSTPTLLYLLKKRRADPSYW